MTTEKSRHNRDFERRGVYTPRNLNIGYGRNGSKQSDEIPPNNFRFKNSLVITPYYEIEFNAMGGIKYLKDHDNNIFFTNDGIFALTNHIRKIPVLIKRSINKQAAQKKLIVEERYNYEEKYAVFKNIILYYEENRIDFQILFNKSNPENNSAQKNPKDITTEFSLNLSVPFISGEEDITAHKDYIIAKSKKDKDFCMTLYPDKRAVVKYQKQNKTLCFITPNNPEAAKNYINLKIYPENYRIT